MNSLSSSWVTSRLGNTVQIVRRDALCVCGAVLMEKILPVRDEGVKREAVLGFLHHQLQDVMVCHSAQRNGLPMGCLGGRVHEALSQCGLRDTHSVQAGCCEG